jgi:hypothetical protein
MSTFKPINQMMYMLFTHIQILFQIIDVYFFFFCKYTGNFSMPGIQKDIFIFFNLSEFSV